MSAAAIVFWVLLAGLAVIPGYAVVCMLWPFTQCRRCNGTGKRFSPSGRNYGRCRWCKGHAERMRLGRRVIRKLGVAKNNLIG